MKQRIQNMNLKNKRVILRLDLNVPINNGKILDDTKIVASLETIKYLLSQNCSIVILSHLGKIKEEADKKKYTLEPIALHLKTLLNQEVYFARENFGEGIYERVKLLQGKEILVLENTRFMDLQGRMESNCDAQLSLFWASLGEVFINDAFASMHRRHASTYGIAEYLPSGIGFLVQRELENLDKYILNPTHPFTIIMGGAKIDDKMDLIEALLPKCDHILCGGGIANTCLKALNFSIGDSLASDDYALIYKVGQIMLHNKEKFVLPLDVIVGSTYDKNYIQYKRVDKVVDNEVILDIGHKTLERFASIIGNSQTIFLNGTVGFYENERFANGTKELFNILAQSRKNVIIGGGDASSSVKKLGYGNYFTYISSGGGATLEYIAKGHLVALDIIKEEGSSIETLDI